MGLESFRPLTHWVILMSFKGYHPYSLVPDLSRHEHWLVRNRDPRVPAKGLNPTVSWFLTGGNGGSGEIHFNPSPLPLRPPVKPQLMFFERKSSPKLAGSGRSMGRQAHLLQTLFSATVAASFGATACSSRPDHDVQINPKRCWATE